MTAELIIAIVSVGFKVYQDIMADNPIDITAEIAALEAARMRTSQEIIDEVDKGV